MGKIEDELMRYAGRLWNSNVVGESKLKLVESKQKPSPFSQERLCDTSGK